MCKLQESTHHGLLTAHLRKCLPNWNIGCIFTVGYQVVWLWHSVTSLPLPSFKKSWLPHRLLWIESFPFYLILHSLITKLLGNVQCRTVAKDSVKKLPLTDVFFLLKVSFIASQTRESSSKTGRHLLGTISSVHPFVISVLLENVSATLDIIGKVNTDQVLCLTVSEWCD